MPCLKDLKSINSLHKGTTYIEMPCSKALKSISSFYKGTAYIEMPCLKALKSISSLHKVLHSYIEMPLVRVGA